MNNVINAITEISQHGTPPEDVVSLAFDSRKVIKGSVFFAIRGTLTDGHQYIDRAIELGATTIVCEVLPETLDPTVFYIVTKDSSIALAEAGCAFFDNPSREITLVGITGTNGKTTTATLLHSLFSKLGYKVGLLSTVVNKIVGRESVSIHTTPDPIELNSLLREMVSEGCQYCFMEVSSHSVVQNRVHGIRFSGAVFTNLTHDHLDYHKTFSEYLKAKKIFFDLLDKKSFALINIDDRNGVVMLQNCNAKHCSYSLQRMADYNCRLKESHIDGMLLELNGREVWTQSIGRFNAYNLTAIYGVAMELGVNEDELLMALSSLGSVPGRFELIRSEQGMVAVVDYAHTPDALQNILSTLSEVCSTGKLITVVGCGGDRDATKRPIMAKIAAQMSSQVILTSDNPRNEDPNKILEQMQSGLDSEQMRRTLVIENRRQAIRTAVTLVHAGDMILIAGKGHETYQERNGVKHHFDDREEVRDAFKEQER